MKVLVLTSGGDAPGMNMVLKKLFKAFKKNLYACYAGFKGLISGDIRKYNDFGFNLSQTASLNYQKEAGSVIKCSRCPEFKTKKGFFKGLENAKNFDFVVILGGNGSYNGAKQLSLHGVNTIFIPATIDNDVTISEYSQGFDTAVYACEDMYKNIMPTMNAFNRCAIFEVMGRKCDAIAKIVFDRVDADFLITQKKDIDLDMIVRRAEECVEDQHACSVILRENIIKMEEFLTLLKSKSEKVDFKGVVVGYTQRGTKPTKAELKIANTFASLTIKQIKRNQKGSFSIVKRNGKFQVIDNI